MNSNLELYEKIRKVPEEAKKTIGAGRLKGMTDINPMWRIKTLTEQFGPCGIGWYYETTKQWIEEVGEERVACVNINLYYQLNGEWSMPVFGTGGSKLSTVETKGVYVSDECYKMAVTDAISVACKSLGMGADVYWNKDRTKYSPTTPGQEEFENMKITDVKVDVLRKKCADEGVDEAKILSLYKVSDFSELTEKMFKNISDNWEKVKKA